MGATLLPMVLLGFYAALGLGQADNYRFSRKWYLLLAPVLVMTYLFVTDEQRHFVCYIVPEEAQPNLAFHPYIGTFLMCGIGLALVLALLCAVLGYLVNPLLYYAAAALGVLAIGLVILLLVQRKKAAAEKPKTAEFAVICESGEPSAEIEELLRERQSAKKAKDFARADAIRAEVAAMGYTITDIPGGVKYGK